MEFFPKSKPFCPSGHSLNGFCHTALNPAQFTAEEQSYWLHLTFVSTSPGRKISKRRRNAQECRQATCFAVLRKMASSFTWDLNFLIFWEMRWDSVAISAVCPAQQIFPVGLAKLSVAFPFPVFLVFASPLFLYLSHNKLCTFLYATLTDPSS